MKYGSVATTKINLALERVFDITASERSNTLSYLLSIDNKEYRKIADEFLAFVYSEVFERLNIQSDCRFDKALLVRLGLPYDADISAVKKRFRELAKQYHPDKGGDPRDFIELVEIYKKLTGGNETVKTP